MSRSGQRHHSSEKNGDSSANQLPSDLIDRAERLYQRSDAFFRAAELILDRNMGASLFSPLYFLLSRSLELSLKGFLILATGNYQHTHDLVKLARQCEDALKMQQVQLRRIEQCPIHPSRRPVVQLMNKSYMNKQIEYGDSENTVLLANLDQVVVLAQQATLHLHMIIEQLRSRNAARTDWDL
jgi:hypothetical protein